MAGAQDDHMPGIYSTELRTSGRKEHVGRFKVSFYTGNTKKIAPELNALRQCAFAQACDI
jgi:hypothetical protein